MIRGEAHGDYFAILCAECGRETQNEYLGGDPAVPYFRVTCNNCGETLTMKFVPLQWKGLPLRLEEDG